MKPYTDKQISTYIGEIQRVYSHITMSDSSSLKKYLYEKIDQEEWFLKLRCSKTYKEDKKQETKEFFKALPSCKRDSLYVKARGTTIEVCGSDAFLVSNRKRLGRVAFNPDASFVGDIFRGDEDFCPYYEALGEEYLSLVGVDLKSRLWCV